MVSSSSDYSFSSFEEDSRIPAAKMCAKTNRAEGSKPSTPLNNSTVTYAEIMKRKAEDDKAEDRQRRKDRIRHRILAAEEKRRFVDGVPSDSDASEEETDWVLSERKIKPDRRTRDLQKIAKQVEDELEAEYKAEDDSDSDDLDIHPDFINGSDSDSDEEEDSDKDDDESDKSDDSGESADFTSDNQKNLSPSHNSRPKQTVRSPARYRSTHTEVGTSVDVRVVVDAGKRRNGESMVVVDNRNNRVDEDLTDSAEAVIRAHVHEYPTAGLPFEAPMINTIPK
ncbi:uncharacterized protein LOC113346240 [Papaver somniferum]|uniref:uncharacterized protein LOC113346240 n=1 Tax=Papaver somniferum TaxID=3469 RepID=UPI000E70573D|nr:uncharacterized protein LOC113346240 [Papaver somniferum]